MNPIYKTGWGQYVDLSKIVSIEPFENIGEKFKDIGCRIYFQLMENAVEKFVSNVRSVACADSYGFRMPMEEEIWAPIRDLRELQISELIMAWESYRNQ